MRYLGIDCSAYGVHTLLAEESGRVVARSAARPEVGLEAALQKALAPCLEQGGPMEVAVAVEGRGWEPCPGLLEKASSLWLCRPEDARLCGSLGARPGLVLQAGSSARVFGVDRAGRPLYLEQEQGSAAWLVEQAVQGADTSLRLDRTWRAHLRSGRPPLAFCERVLELASFPGPDPHCRALVMRAARSLAELVRWARSRLRFHQAPAGSWLGVAMAPPLLELFQEEIFRYHPEIRWARPHFPPEAGCALLALAGFRERQRRGDTDPLVRPVNADVWRYVYRMRKPFPEFRG